MSANKSISVAMCTYNGERFLRDQLESIAAQTRLPEELVICDDRSTDSTVDIIHEFAQSAPFPVRLHINPVNLGGSAKGITKNFEQASGLCIGELIAFSDQDDAWLSKKLERMAQSMENTPRVGGVFSDAQLINDQGVRKGVRLSETGGMTGREQRRLAGGKALPVLLSMTKVFGCSLMVDRNLLRKVLPVPAHWWFDAWVACTIAVYSELLFIPEELFLYRIHATQFGGASVPTVSERVKQWKSSAREYWEEAEPQLADLYSRLAAQDDASVKRHMEYLRGRMDLLRFRSELPSNPFSRAMKVLPAIRKYQRYFNGWKSVIKDLTAAF